MARHELAGARWKRTRAAAKDRAGWRCQRCGGRRRLEVHHRRAVADGGAVHDPGNLEVLCRACHLQHHHGDHLQGEPEDRRALRELLAQRLADLSPGT